jgi:hypothetical protein
VSRRRRIVLWTVAAIAVLVAVALVVTLILIYTGGSSDIHSP